MVITVQLVQDLVEAGGGSHSTGYGIDDEKDVLGRFVHVHACISCR